MEEPTTTKVNADLIRSAYDAFSRGDIAGAFAVFAKDILWHIPRGADRCRVTIADTPRCKDFFSISWSCPPAPFGFM